MHPLTSLGSAILLAAGLSIVTPVGPAAAARPALSGPNTWQATAPPGATRSGQTATLLGDGEVLIAGGGTATAELYDPATRSFSPTGRMSVARTDATATLLQDGQVLEVGGTGSAGRQLASAERYDPSSGTWSTTAPMGVARSGQTATLLSDGDVLVAGGGCNPGHSCDAGSFLDALSSATLYDPSSGTWSAAGHMSSGRQSAAASLLSDGQVLVTGGFASCDDDFCSDTNSADRYDPATGTWHPTGRLPSAREQQTSTVLRNGDVLVAGGKRLNPNSDVARALLSAAVYHPTSGTWTAAPAMPSAHSGQAAVLLPDGWVLLASGGSTASQVYQPGKRLWVRTGGTSGLRRDQSMVSLADGDVLLAGGGIDSAQVFEHGVGPLVTTAPGAADFGAQQVGSTSRPRTVTVTNQGTAGLQATGLVVTGRQARDFSATSSCIGATISPGGTCTLTVRFRPSGTGARSADVGLVDDAPPSPQRIAVHGYGNGPNTWAPSRSMAVGRTGQVSTLLGTGDVLVAGGYTETGPTDEAELYDATTRSFTGTGSMIEPDSLVTGTLLADGDVLVAGGYTANGPTATAQLYDPSTGTWTPTGSMSVPGDLLTQTLLPSGDVLVTGTDPGTVAELYDPTSGMFSQTGRLVQPTSLAAATLMGDGDVLLAGGIDTSVAQVYDPGKNSWSATAPTLVARQNPRAVLLPDGDVLLAGGVDSVGDALASAEVYDPTAHTWKLTAEPMSTGRAGFTLVVLPGGAVMAAGGCTGSCDSGVLTASTEFYLEQYGYWTPGPSMTTGHQGASATLLPDGELLVTGGTTACCTYSAGAETYTVPIDAAQPDQGPVGTRVTVSGRGFFAFERVKIRLDYSVIGSATATRQGTFSTLVTVPQASVGAHAIVASGVRSYAQASCPFTVTSSG